jgi:hypothetical protein
LEVDVDPSQAVGVTDLLGDADPVQLLGLVFSRVWQRQPGQEAAWHQFLLWVALACAIAGPIGVWSGLRAIQTGRRLRKQGVRVPGVVVRLRFSRSANDSGGTYHPVLRFRTVEGQDMETESDVATYPAPARKGAQVIVIYDPQTPTLARIDSMIGRGTAAGGLFVAVGLIVTSIAAWISVIELL